MSNRISNSITNRYSSNGMGEYLDGLSTKLTDLEDGRMTKILHHKITYMDFSMLMVNFIGIYSAVLYYDSDKLNPGYKFNELLLQVCLGASLMLIPLIYFRAKTTVKYMKYKGKLPKNANIVSSGLYKKMLLSWVLCFLQPNKILKGKFMTFYNSEESVYVSYPLNDILCAALLIRTVPLFSTVFAGVRYNSNRADRIW